MQVLKLNQGHKFQGKASCSNCKSKLLLNHNDVFVCSYEVPSWYANRGEVIRYAAFECSACGSQTELTFKFWQKKDYSFASKKQTGIITEFNPKTGIGYMIENAFHSYKPYRQVPFKLDKDIPLAVGDVVEVSSFCGSRAWGLSLPVRSYFKHVSADNKGEKTFILENCNNK